MIIKRCKNCNKEFESLKSKNRKFCSVDCFNIYRTNKIVKKCKFCGEKFETVPSRIKNNRGKYCSKDCSNKDITKVEIVCQNCGDIFIVHNHRKNIAKFCSRDCFFENQIGKKISEETKNKISESNSGKKRTEKAKQKMREAALGRKRPPRSKEWRRNLSNALKGDNSPTWKGGKTDESKKARNSVDYKIWRESVYKRDDYTCQKSGKKGGRLHPHHIENFADNPDKRYDVNNGITLSVKEHKKFHKKYGRNNTTRKQLKEFLNTNTI